jgi:hypothetical protein
MGLQSVMFGNVKSEGVGSHLRACSHDYLFAIGLSQLVPPAILNLPAAFNSSDVRNASTHGCIGASSQPAARRTGTRPDSLDSDSRPPAFQGDCLFPRGRSRFRRVD